MVNYREEKHTSEAKNEGESIKALCRSCRQTTVHTILKSQNLTRYYEASGRSEIEFQSWEEYQIIQCKGCEDLSFRLVEEDDENVTYDRQNQLQPTSNITLYPLRLKDAPESIRDWHLPDKVRKIYQETLSSFTHDDRILTGVGIRAIVESVCKDKKAKGKNLIEQINSLKENELLTPSGADILHKLRIMGNSAAHDVKPHSTDELRLALDVIRHLLESVYILPKEAKQLAKPKS